MDPNPQGEKKDVFKLTRRWGGVRRNRYKGTSDLGAYIGQKQSPTELVLP